MRVPFLPVFFCFKLNIVPAAKTIAIYNFEKCEKPDWRLIIMKHEHKKSLRKDLDQRYE